MHIEPNKHPKTKSMPWAICIFACRETLSTLLLTLESLLLSDCSTKIDILINGNDKLSGELLEHILNSKTLSTNSLINVWSIAFGDKANAWNQYLHTIWSGEELVFFVDGYVRLRPDAVRLLGSATMSDESCLGGTGVPSTSRSDKKFAAIIVQEGGFHGNFCCIKGWFINEFRQRRFFIPVGLYRTDSLVGAALCFRLDPLDDWRKERIRVEPKATWATDPKQWWNLIAMKDTLKRRIRQARGILENAAVKDHIVNKKQTFESLTPIASQLILDWISRYPTKAQLLMLRNPTAFLGLRELRSAPKWSSKSISATLAWPKSSNV
jgi:hypothetical protein